MIALGCQAHDHEDDHATRAASAIVAGDADTGDPAIVAVGPRRIHCNDALAPFCSGVLVAPRVVLTAAHCFVGKRPGAPYEVFFGADVAGVGEERSVTKIVTPDTYDGGNGGGDLALLVLDSAATAAPIALGSLTAGDVGKTVKMAGFGITEDGGGIGVKRFGTGNIQSIDTDTFRTTPSPSMTCDGDSGGPLLLSGAGGDVIVGITSFGDPGCTMFAENARVDTFAAFIGGVIADTPDAGADPDPADSPPANVCNGSCTSANECGAGFDCPASPDAPGRCTLDGLPPGDFGDTCTDDSQCTSAICARLGSAPTSCRCLSACAVSGPSFDGSVDADGGSAPPDTSTGCGCRFAGNSASFRASSQRPASRDDAWIAIAGFLLVVSGCRRRKIDA